MLNKLEVYKKCESCELVDLIQGANESASKFKFRRTCSDECKADLRQSKRLKRAEANYGVGCLDDKECVVCDCVFSIAEKEPIQRYAGRLTCSFSCGSRLGAHTKIHGDTKTFKEVVDKYVHSAPSVRPLAQDAISGSNFGFGGCKA